MWIRIDRDGTNFFVDAKYVNRIQYHFRFEAMFNNGTVQERVVEIEEYEIVCLLFHCNIILSELFNFATNV